MKKLLLLGMLCLGATSGYAQHSNIQITNSSGCDVHLELYGDMSGSPCSSTNYATGLLTIAPGPPTMYDPTTIPGGMNCIGGCMPPTLGPSDIFWHAIVYKAPQCGTPTTTFKLEDNGCFVNTYTTYANYDAFCVQCSPQVQWQWTNMGTYIQLDIW